MYTNNLIVIFLLMPLPAFSMYLSTCMLIFRASWTLVTEITLNGFSLTLTLTLYLPFDTSCNLNMQEVNWQYWFSQRLCQNRVSVTKVQNTGTRHFDLKNPLPVNYFKNGYLFQVKILCIITSTIAEGISVLSTIYMMFSQKVDHKSDGVMIFSQ